MRLLEFRQGMRFAGHPLHAMLVHFPMAFWLLVFPCEFLAWSGEWELGRLIAFWANAAGLATSLPAALTGLMDLPGLKSPRAAALGNRHMVFMLSAAALFGADFSLGMGADPKPGLPVFLNLGLSFVGTALLMCGGWLGGELVFRHRAGQESITPDETPRSPA